MSEVCLLGSELYFDLLLVCSPCEQKQHGPPGFQSRSLDLLGEVKPYWVWAIQVEPRCGFWYPCTLTCLGVAYFPV